MVFVRGCPLLSDKDHDQPSTTLVVGVRTRTARPPTTRSRPRFLRVGIIVVIQKKSVVVVVVVVVVAGSEGDTTVVITVTALSRSSPPSIRTAIGSNFVWSWSSMFQICDFLCAFSVFLIFLMDVVSSFWILRFPRISVWGARDDYFQECGIPANFFF